MTNLTVTVVSNLSSFGALLLLYSLKRTQANPLGTRNRVALFVVLTDYFRGMPIFNKCSDRYHVTNDRKKSG